MFEQHGDKSECIFCGLTFFTFDDVKVFLEDAPSNQPKKTAQGGVCHEDNIRGFLHLQGK